MGLEDEIVTYLRELKRLVEEGGAGQYALIRGNDVLSVWETQGDAIQVAREKFGLEPVCVKRIDPRDAQRLAALAVEDPARYAKFLPVEPVVTLQGE